MKRSIRLCLFTLLFSILALPFVYGQSGAKEPLAGTIEQGEARVLLKEVIYYVSQSLVVKGTLIIEPGTTIEFREGGRIVVGTGGRLIADGFAHLAAKPLPATILNQGVVNTFGEEGYASMACFLFPAYKHPGLTYLPAWNTQYIAGPLGASEINSRERTINPSKYNAIFNVGINATTRRIVDIQADESPRIDVPNANGTWGGLNLGGFSASSSNSDVYIVPFETALMFAAARLEGPDAPLQHGIQNTTWKRANNTSVDITPGVITFVGQPVNVMSDEYGHIIVLPGARAAFFRNCTFERIRKDTLVDRLPFYAMNTIADTVNAHPRRELFLAASAGVQAEALAHLNNEMIKLTNGGGGAVTTFSSRTWLINCNFNRNFAKLRGGAVQILQAPTLAYFNNDEVLMKADTTGKGITRYNFDTKEQLLNKWVTDQDDSLSIIHKRFKDGGVTGADIYPAYPKIDNINVQEPEDAWFANDNNRAPWDDARLAGYLGRFRNLTFTDNMVRLANIAILQDPQGGMYHGDDTLNPVQYPYPLGDSAVGGAMYISGTGDEGREIEFGLGINEALGLGNAANVQAEVAQNPNDIAGFTKLKDYIRFERNSAQNLQDSKNSGGSKGGAIYVGKNTSLIVAGEFIDNFTSAKFLVDASGTGKGVKGTDRTEFTFPPTTFYHDGLSYSRGGAIYSDPNNGRLQVRGGVERSSFPKMISSGTSLVTETVTNTTLFRGNTAGAGGAIYVDYSTGDGEALMSPHIGGGPTTTYNNFGIDIRFLNNRAHVAGGAVYTGRNMAVYGAGGKDNNYLYSWNYAVNFDTNSAGFAGGAIHIEIPETELASHITNSRVVNLERARFTANNVNKAASENVNHINNTADVVDQVRGGGGMYVRNASLNVVKATQFDNNYTYNGNGGAIAAVNADKAITRYFLTDLDQVSYETQTATTLNDWPGAPAIANSFVSVNNPFTFGATVNRDGWYKVAYPDETITVNAPDGTPVTSVLTTEHLPIVNVRMLTRLENNIAEVDSTIGQTQITQYGNTQVTNGYVMPDNTFNTQWWFAPDSGFVGGANGWMHKIFFQNNKILWTEKMNHTHPADDNIDNWGKNSFTAMYFHNANRGYLADNQGDIWKYENGAIRRVYSLSSVSTTGGQFTDMTFAGPNVDAGLAITSLGNIYSTTDGNTWSLINTPSVTGNRRLNNIHIVNTNLAYVVGDGGAFIKLTRNDVSSPWTGETIVISGLNENLTGVFFLNNSTGYVIGTNATMLKTTDGGENWAIKTISTPANSKETFTDIDFYVGPIGYVISDLGNIYKTTNSGEDWTKLNQIWSSRFSPKSIQVKSSTLLFVVGAHDLVDRSIDGGLTWTSMHPADTATREGNPRHHGGISNLVENGVGLGGALYVLDYQILNRDMHKDYFTFNRVRVQDNSAFSGSAIYSDNFNLKLKFERSLIRGNKTDTTNTIGKDQNFINGPINRDPKYKETNFASSDLAAATIYGEIVNAFPANNVEFSTKANSIFENEARFLIRLPDAPNTKGLLAGGKTGAGYTGVDTLMGNYWGKTEANVGLKVMNRQGDITGGMQYQLDSFMTFFVEKRANNKPLIPDGNYLSYYNHSDSTTQYLDTIDYRRQGPFEYNYNDYVSGADRGVHKYEYIELSNQWGAAGEWLDSLPQLGTIPEKWLFSGDIYDLHDKGVAVKIAEYSKRRMFPIEDFAVGNPVQIVLHDSEYVDQYDLRGDSLEMKYVKRYIYNPEYSHAVADIGADGNVIYANEALYNLNKYPWRPMKEEGTPTNDAPKYYHPLGMPLYLETKADWYFGDINSSNFDMNHQASTVFFVINETTLDYIRVDLKQIPTRSFADANQYTYSDSLSGLDKRFRATVFFVPDSSKRASEGLTRRNVEQLRSWGSDGSFPFEDAAGPGPHILRALSPRNLENNFTAAYNGISVAANNEDFGALHGRKYSVVSSPDRVYFYMGDNAPGKDDPIIRLFPNRERNGQQHHMPDDNDWRPTATDWPAEDINHRGTKTTFFGGERYGTLPVNVGDVIRVVSRSVLWKQGPVRAYEGGLVFQIHEGPEAPEFVGDVTMWGDTLTNPYVTDTAGNWPIGPGLPTADGHYLPDTIRNYDLLNKVFVRTNRTYPWNGQGVAYADESRADNDRGTNFILKATAIDRNNFYDPRNLLNLSSTTPYMGLIYNWYINEGDSASRANKMSGLSRWLSAGKHYENIEVETDSVKGYLEFKGYPINPYIVPSGERIRLSVRNYAPGVEMLDSIMTVTASQDTIKWFYQTFPPYLSSPYYNRDMDHTKNDEINGVTAKGGFDEVARYLQQDTMGARASSEVLSDNITIFVMDSLPRFIDYRATGVDTADATAETFWVKESLYTTNNVEDTSYITRPYRWTRFQAGVTAAKEDGNISFTPKYKMNFAGIPDSSSSYQLRFKMDLNTDDEMEDLAAEQTNNPGPWHFPYGRTAYSFENKAINGGDGSGDADTSDSDIHVNGTGYTTMPLRPSWMLEEFFFEYNHTTAAPAMPASPLDFQRRGQINFRMDSANVHTLLRRDHVDGIQYNTDTMMAIVCNDGHGGLSSKYIDLYVNFQPEVLEVTLPTAVEGREYNIKRDTNVAIKIFDANQDQRHTFELIHKGSTITEVVLDPAFPEETRFTLPTGEGWGETPTWLNIDPVSGVLYGKTDVVLDLGDTNTYITVIVTDEDSLRTVARIPFQQSTGNCPPEIVAIDANMDCIVRGQVIDNNIVVFDRDLIRTGAEVDTLTLSVNINGTTSTALEVSPAQISGPNPVDSKGYDTVRLVNIGTNGLEIDANLWQTIEDNGYLLPIDLIVTDKNGSTDTFQFNLRIADSVDFLSKVLVTNSIGYSQILEWGVGGKATTGMENGQEGILDERYCEIEIPVYPPNDVFDARWTIPTISGTHRNIYPRVNQSDAARQYVYIGGIRPGSVAAGQGDYYPVTIQWDVKTVPAPNAGAVNPSEACWYIKDPTSNGSYFHVRMYDGTIYKQYASSVVTRSGDTMTVTLKDNTIPAGFHIVYSSHVDIEETELLGTAIQSVSPSPVHSGQTDANMTFSLAKSGDISIEMFDMLGNKVMTIANTYYPAGSHMLNFNLNDNRSNRLASGAYTIRLTAGVEVKQFKLIVLQ